MRFESGLQLHCVEHDLPQSAYSSGDGTAMSAAKGLARFDAGAEQAGTSWEWFGKSGEHEVVLSTSGSLTWASL